MIGSQIMKFTKILYHEKLELYGIIRGGSRGVMGGQLTPPSVLNTGAEPRGGGNTGHIPPPPPDQKYRLFQYKNEP